MLCIGIGRVGNNCNGSEEMNSTEESSADATAIYLWLAPPK